MTNTCEKYTDAEICDALLRRNYSSIGKEFVDDKVKVIRPFVFYNVSTISTICCPNITVIGRQALAGCRATSVTFPWEKITSIGYRAFYGTAATSANATTQSELHLDALVELDDYAFANASVYTATTPLESVSAAILETIPGNAFRNQVGLVSVEFPSAVLCKSSAFEGCTALKTVRFGASLTTIQARSFYGCKALETLILDGVTAVPTISNANAFMNTPLASGDGFVYVPDDMVSAFQSANIWSGYQIKAISEMGE